MCYAVAPAFSPPCLQVYSHYCCEDSFKKKKKRCDQGGQIVEAEMMIQSRSLAMKKLMHHL